MKERQLRAVCTERDSRSVTRPCGQPFSPSGYLCGDLAHMRTGNLGVRSALRGTVRTAPSLASGRHGPAVSLPCPWLVLTITVIPGQMATGGLRPRLSSQRGVSPQMRRPAAEPRTGPGPASSAFYVSCLGSRVHEKRGEHRGSSGHFQHGLCASLSGLFGLLACEVLAFLSVLLNYILCLYFSAS